MALLFKNITHFYNVQLPMGNDIFMIFHPFVNNFNKKIQEALRRILMSVKKELFKSEFGHLNLS